jgi:hypothetical protein
VDFPIRLTHLNGMERTFSASKRKGCALQEATGPRSRQDLTNTALSATNYTLAHHVSSTLHSNENSWEQRDIKYGRKCSILPILHRIHRNIHKRQIEIHHTRLTSILWNVINPVSLWNAFGSSVATNAVIYRYISNAVVTSATGSFVVPFASQNVYGISPL